MIFKSINQFNSMKNFHANVTMTIKLIPNHQSGNQKSQFVLVHYLNLMMKTKLSQQTMFIDQLLLLLHIMSYIENMDMELFQEKKLLKKLDFQPQHQRKKKSLKNIKIITNMKPSQSHSKKELKLSNKNCRKMLSLTIQRFQSLSHQNQLSHQMSYHQSLLLKLKDQASSKLVRT